MLYSSIRKIRKKLHNKFMKDRFNLFLKKISINKGDIIVDLGGGNGSFMEFFGDNIRNYNIIIADISKIALNDAEKKGFKTLLLQESELLPFKDKEVDIIFCNSVIEHYTIPKSLIWQLKSDNEFKRVALKAQYFIASEIDRVSKKYFVQTPNKSFPIESHTFFPFAAQLSRPYKIRLINFLNKFWVKKTTPDWNLLNKHDMKLLFPNGEIIEKKWLGCSKEIIAYKDTY